MYRLVHGFKVPRDTAEAPYQGGMTKSREPTDNVSSAWYTLKIHCYIGQIVGVERRTKDMKLCKFTCTLEIIEKTYKFIITNFKVWMKPMPEKKENYR